MLATPIVTQPARLTRPSHSPTTVPPPCVFPAHLYPPARPPARSPARGLTRSCSGSNAKQSIAHALRRQGPNRFGACFLSVTERFDPDAPFGFFPVTTPSGVGPGAGERGNGGDIAGPVERYDLVSSRQQPPAGGRGCVVGGWDGVGAQSPTGQKRVCVCGGGVTVFAARRLYSMAFRAPP